MDWLKKIIEKHTKEDGTIDMAAAMAEINTEFPKNAVPKATFNDVNGQLKEATTTIGELKKANGDNETLQSTIKAHEATIESLKITATNKEKEFKLKAAFEKEGAIDADYLIFKQGGLDKFEMDKEGNIKDLDNLVKQAKETVPTFFKATDPTAPPLKPIDKTLPPGAPGSKEPEDLASAIKSQMGL